MTDQQTLMPNAGVIDVSELPATAFDTKAPLWWGNTLLLFIETAMFGILVAHLFLGDDEHESLPAACAAIGAARYIRRGPGPVPADDRTGRASFKPDTRDLARLISARAATPAPMQMALVVTLAFNIAAIVIRYYEYDSLHFKWNDNAYGSITWMILGMHMLHMFVMAAEDTYLLIWTFIKGADEKHAVDLTVTAVYWYWIVGIWVPLYFLIYIVPRFAG